MGLLRHWLEDSYAKFKRTPRSLLHLLRDSADITPLLELWTLQLSGIMDFAIFWNDELCNFVANLWNYGRCNFMELKTLQFSGIRAPTLDSERNFRHGKGHPHLILNETFVTAKGTNT